MTEMNMHRGNLKLMMVVMRICQPVRQFPRVVVKNIGKCSNTFSGYAAVETHLLET
jgi:hypothetical protein